LLRDPVGGIVGTQLRTTGSRNSGGGVRGWADMWWLTVDAVGFLIMTALAIALARRSTARWENEKRAARATRRSDVTPRTPPGGPTAGLRSALVRTAAAASRVTAPIGRPVRAATGVLVTARTQVSSRIAPAARRFGGLRPAVRGRRKEKAGRRKEKAGSLRAHGGGAEPGVAPRAVLPTPRLPIRRTLRFVPRHARRRDRRARSSDADQSPTAP
jgi:hypothetical protein